MGLYLRKFSPKEVTLVKRHVLVEKDFEGTLSKVCYLVLDVSSIKMDYSPGDLVGIFPENSTENVNCLIKKTFLNPSKIIHDPVTQENLSFEEFIRSRVDFVKIPKMLLSLAKPEDTLLSLCKREGNFLNLSEQDFCNNLYPLMPRFYSIASSQRYNSSQIGLLVKLVSLRGANDQYGTASFFLCCSQEEGTKIKIFFKKSPHFYLSESSKNKPIIMIGCGTGMAPFRAFAQERYLLGEKENYLFFGEKTEEYFFCKSFWLKLYEKGFLKYFCAFSRKETKKFYIQDLLEQKKDLIADLVNKKDARIYVCGRKLIGKEIENVLCKIFSLEILRTFKKNGRYMKDVY